MVSTPMAPGAAGFKTICRSCSQIVDVRSDSKVFRIEPHTNPKRWYHADDVGIIWCPYGGLQWEQT